MARVNWMVLCTGTALDTHSKSSLSLLNIVNDLNVALSKPLAKGDTANIRVQLRLAILWRRTDRKKGEKVNVRYAWGRPNGLKAPPITATIDLREFAQNQHVTNIEGLAVDGPGEYKITAQLQKIKGGKSTWTTVASLPVNVAISSQST